MNDSEKIKYHIQLLAEALDVRENPIVALVVSNDWSDSDLDAAHDIFEKFDQKLEEKQAVNWHAFEREFKDRFGFSYQGLKSVVLAFFRNGQWIAVCEAYAKEHPCVEFSEILSRGRREFGGLLLERVAAVFARNNIPYDRELAIKTADGKTIRLDFFLNLPRARVAVEVKGILNQGALDQVAHLASELKSGAKIDEFWLVVEGPPMGGFNEADRGFIKILTLDELEEKVSTIF